MNECPVECLPPDCVGDILYWVTEGLFAFNGQHAAHPLLDACVVLELCKNRAEAPRGSMSMREAVARHLTRDDMAYPWVADTCLAELAQTMTCMVVRMLGITRLSRQMARLVLPHWKHVYALVRVLGSLRCQSCLVPSPRIMAAKGFPPRLPGKWYRMACVRYLAGRFDTRHRRVLHTSFYKMAPELLACTTAWETSVRVQQCGLADLKSPHVPTRNDWMNGPTESRAWLEDRLTKRWAAEAHAKAFQKKLALLWRRSVGMTRVQDEESDDWQY